MIHSEVYGHYVECLPDRAAQTKEYFPNGRNSIRVRQNDGQEFVFTFIESDSWKFETIDEFLAGMMKGEKKHA